MSVLGTIRTKPRLWASAGLVAVGVTSGAILGSTFTASAATSGTSSTSASSSTNSGSNSTNNPSGAPAAQMPGCHGPHALPNSGTVSAVGSNSVTIDGKTYAVTSSSDIDKNGEAALSNLAVGDKVTFSTVSGAATPTIDKLHAGNEALNRPAGPPPGGPQGGTAPQQSSGSTSSAA